MQQEQEQKPRGSKSLSSSKSKIPHVTVEINIAPRINKTLSEFVLGGSGGDPPFNVIGEKGLI